jgi:hypothetical protein
VFHAGEFREFLFQPVHLRAHHPLPAFDGRLDGARKRCAEAPALRLQIDEGNGDMGTLRIRIALGDRRF